jgi:putative transcriptional regulator
MSKRVFEGILRGLEDALAHAKGDPQSAARTVHVAVRPADIKMARKRIGLSREAFAHAFGLSAATLRKWENGEREPTGAARVLLTIISREPEAALRAIRRPHRAP